MFITIELSSIESASATHRSKASGRTCDIKIHPRPYTLAVVSQMCDSLRWNITQTSRRKYQLSRALVFPKDLCQIALRLFRNFLHAVMIVLHNMALNSERFGETSALISRNPMQAGATNHILLGWRFVIIRDNALEQVLDGNG
jgi:hypothetical protein